MEQYLELIHGQPHTLFHPTLLKRRIRDGTESEAVVIAILAISARLSARKDVLARVDWLSRLARNTLKRDLDQIGIENIQASILVGNLLGTEGDVNAESLFFGVAMRIAHVLSLPSLKPTGEAVGDEIKRRVCWSLYMIDVWHSSGLSIPRQMRSVSIDLPMDELTFYSLPPSTTQTVSGTAATGLWAQMVTLAHIFGEIQDLHHQHVEGHLGEAAADSKAEQIAAMLERFTSCLPKKHTLNTE